VFSYQNVYAARITGLEGSAGWVAPGGWASLEASATIEDVRNASSEGTFGAFEGDRIPNRPWLFGALGGSLRRGGVLRAGDELSLFATSRYVHAFFRGWESLGRRDAKQIVPSQLVHGAGVTYATRGTRPITATVELQNLTDARAYDSYGVQRPGRALYVKLSAELF
jgi:vitamin B12 transporter